MPLYMCNAVAGAIPKSAREKIAADITRIHCEVTGAPRSFVNVFFFEDAPQQPLRGRRVFMYGSIRAGRTSGQKHRLTEDIKSSIHTAASIPLDEIVVDTVDVPASWVMEGGGLLPEPGDEEAWLVEHEMAP